MKYYYFNFFLFLFHGRRESFEVYHIDHLAVYVYFAFFSSLQRYVVLHSYFAQWWQRQQYSTVGKRVQHILTMCV